MGVEMIYEDAELLVCEKSAGFPVQSRRIGEKDCVSVLKSYLYEKNPGKGEPYLGIVHRLDQPVEGVMVFAKTRSAAANLSGQLSKNGFCKKYQAVVCGKMEQKSGTLVDYLRKDGKTNMSFVMTKDAEGSKRAELSYRVLKEQELYSLVEIDLVTGRHHQIRVQMANAGHPLYGDRKYAPAGERAAGKEAIGLCAVKLTFFHPKTKKKMEFFCQPTGQCFSWFA